MQQGRRTVLGLALLGTCGPLMAAVPPGDGGADAALDAELAAIAADPACQLASLSVLAIRNGKVSYERQFGQRVMGNGAQPGRAADRNTLYRIASISKMMTTLGLMRLLEEAKVALDADVAGYLGFPLRNSHFPDRPITLRSLLTHRSSLRDDGGYSWPADTAPRAATAIRWTASSTAGAWATRSSRTRRRCARGWWKGAVSTRSGTWATPTACARCSPPT